MVQKDEQVGSSKIESEEGSVVERASNKGKARGRVDGNDVSFEGKKGTLFVSRLFWESKRTTYPCS